MTFRLRPAQRIGLMTTVLHRTRQANHTTALRNNVNDAANISATAPPPRRRLTFPPIRLLSSARRLIFIQNDNDLVEPLVILTLTMSVMVSFKKVVDSNSYRLNNRSHCYGKQTAGLVNLDTRQMEKMMKRYIFSGKDPIEVITFLCKIFLTFNSINIHEGK